MAFKMRSQSAVSSGGFKMMGSSPMKNDGHDAPTGHVHDKNDRNKWTHQEVTEDADGKKIIRNSKGTVGKEGTPDTVIENPGTSKDADPVAKDIPTAKEGEKTKDPDAYIKKLKERFPNATRQDMIDKGYISSSWSGEWSDPVETKEDPDKKEPTTTVIEGDPGTDDTREDKAIEAGPGKDAVTSDIDFWDASKEGRKSNRKKGGKKKGKKKGGGGSGGSGICNRESGEGCSVNW